MLPHRESKDVFILGGVDDIQAALDDSQVMKDLSYNYDYYLSYFTYL